MKFGLQAAELTGATLELETAWPASDLVLAEANGQPARAQIFP